MIPGGGSGMFGSGPGAPRMMITVDPPDHMHYRRLAVPDFIPKAVREKLPRITALATQIIDGGHRTRLSATSSPRSPA